MQDPTTTQKSAEELRRELAELDRRIFEEYNSTQNLILGSEQYRQLLIGGEIRQQKDRFIIVRRVTGPNGSPIFDPVYIRIERLDDLDKKRQEIQEELANSQEQSGLAVQSSTNVTENPATVEVSAKIHPRSEAETSNKQESYVFRKTGDLWRIVFNGEELPPLRASKGLYYIAHLLTCPYTIVSALDLQNAIGGCIKADVRNSELLSDERLPSEETHQSREAQENSEIRLGKSKEEYKRILNGYYEELKEAERNNDTAKEKNVKEQIKLVAQQISDAGIYPSKKEIPLEIQRARSTVTKAIQSARRKISKKSPALEEYLRKHISTGYTCQYTPDPNKSIDWNF